MSCSKIYIFALFVNIYLNGQCITKMDNAVYFFFVVLLLQLKVLSQYA